MHTQRKIAELERQADQLEHEGHCTAARDVPAALECWRKADDLRRRAADLRVLAVRWRGEVQWRVYEAARQALGGRD